MAELDESSGATRPPPERSDEGSGTKRPRVDEAPSVVEVHVAAMLATRTGPERATAAHVVSLLHVAEGVDTVASEPTADGRTLTLRSGPFFLRPATAPEGPLPPALLWCFACLACGAGEEPEVTFDEAESCLDFLRALAAKHVDGERAIVDGAIDAVEAMIRDSAPLDEAAKTVHVLANFLSPDECAAVVAGAEAHAAARGGWTSARHAAHATTDVPAGDVPGVADWIFAAARTRLLPRLEEVFGLEDALIVDDLFVAKYDADGQRELPEHEDGSPFSFVAPLNGGGDFDGGGTQFVDLDGAPVYRPDAGDALLFSGQNRHRGVPIERGTRYVLAGFCAFAEGEDDEASP